MLVMFDLPVTSPAERKAATKFRKFLLDDGYYMMQYSVYIRICNGNETAHKHLARLQNSIPLAGSVRAIMITEKQYESMKILCGQKNVEFDKNAAQQMVLAF
ncbi:CRISPR-associated protein Cas2 [Selenomonas ruminantium]|uniref:CRISPR-associated endoribonuclease Cas2 n=1 Tax=Selenomonas ruminantium TaxID=971 RepID=A0A1M6STI2_SELRU|nr:CRISPR-associated protein Cas2 [Selenomonas ruminantium]